MKLINNNISPLPFYDSIDLQNHRKDYAFGNIYPLIIHKNILLPFQVLISSGSAINWVRLHDFNSGKYLDITSQLIDNGLILKSYSNFSILKYPGKFPINGIGHEGRFYLSISIQDLGTIYSDIFTSSNTLNGFIHIEYSNLYSFELNGGIIDFSDGFSFECYLPAQIGKPEYEFEEEATERMGYSFIESQVSKKVYKFTFLAPEYMCDALRIIRLCSDKRITDDKLLYNMTSFNMRPQWEEQGDLASVECEFETDTVVSNLGGYLSDAKGDFNDDFNDDFSIY